MKHVAAYLLLQLGGNTSPSAADITSLLEAGGVEADSSRIEKLISELEGKDINEVRFSRCWFRVNLISHGDFFSTAHR